MPLCEKKILALLPNPLQYKYHMHLTHVNKESCQNQTDNIYFICYHTNLCSFCITNICSFIPSQKERYEMTANSPQKKYEMITQNKQEYYRMRWYLRQATLLFLKYCRITYHIIFQSYAFLCKLPGNISFYQQMLFNIFQCTRQPQYIRPKISIEQKLKNCGLTH